MDFWNANDWKGVAPAVRGIAPARSSEPTNVNIELRDLRHQLSRLALLNQALWEILRTRLNLTDADLEKMAAEVDLRDGQADGRITDHALRCPQCNRVSSSRHQRCIYCNQPFDGPIFGSPAR